MAAVAADRHLLLGLLALQNGLINQSQLVAAFQAWTLEKSRPLADHLVALGHLSPAQRSVVEAMAALHVEAHGGDVEKSLAAVPAGKSTLESLADVGDPEIERTLSHVGSGRGPTEDGDADRTASYAVGTATSDGQRFRVLRPHARGGLGAVFVALDSELNREVAVKQILDRHADDPTSRQRFLLEAEVTGGLEHPGIVPVYGLGTYADGRPYYAMRFIRGDSLKEAIDRFHSDETMKRDPSRRSLELRKLLRRFLDVCNAIEYAHSRGVLHRDLKPGNIIVGKHGETLVVDWGLAKATGRGEGAEPSEERPLTPSSSGGSAETLPGSALGTPAYMSPEQARGEIESLGRRSDVYSLGATLYCLLTGRPSQEGGDIGEVLRRVQHGESTPPRQLDPSIDKALEAVCCKAMAPLPEDRYGSCRELAEDIDRWLADEPVSALREPWTERARRSARRHRSLVTAGAAALVVALIALGGIVALESQSNRRLRLANARETRAREQAQARFRLARDAVAGYYRGVSEDVLLRRTEFRDLRRSLLKSAQDFYRQLATTLEAEQELEPAARLDLARAELALARITGEIASTGDALKAAEPARALLARLAAERPDDPGLRRELAGVLSLIGSYHDATGQTDEALAALGRALRIRQALAAAPGATSDDRAALAGTHTSIGSKL
jgi:serine/threonine-protein kinase